MKKHIGVVVLGVTIIAVLLLYMVAFTVRWQEKALVLTFNKISREVTEPGLQWRWPVFQKVLKFDGRIRTLQQQLTEIRTRDKQTVIVSVYVNWRITNARTFYERFRQESSSDSADVIKQAERTIKGWISEASNIFAKYKFADLVTLGESKLAALEKGSSDQFGGMQSRIQEKAQAGDGYGVEILDLGISRLGVPDDVTTSVFSRMREERQAVVRTLVSDGEKQATSITADAKREATILKAQAQAEAKDIRGRGDAAAAKYYQAFVQDAKLANFLRRLETLRKTLSERTTIILNSKSPPYQLLTTGSDLLRGEDVDSEEKKGSSTNAQ